MPGRPRTKLKRVADLAAKAHEIADNLFSLLPDQIQEEQRAHPSDHVGQVWVVCMNAITDTHRELDNLTELLAAKVEQADAAAANREEQVISSNI